MIDNPIDRGKYGFREKGKYKRIFNHIIKYFSGTVLVGIIFVAYAIFGNYHLGYGSGGVSLHQENEANPTVQYLETSYSSINNSQETDENAPAEYEIKSGDTIWGIADRYNIKVSDLLKVNKLTPESIIKPGQKINLQSTENAMAKTESKKLNFQVEAVIADSDVNSEKRDLEDWDSSERKPFDYEVESGDTVSVIAERYNLKINTILWANNLTAKSKIQPGQKLILLPVDGVLHKVSKGDVIGKIAALHKADEQKILDYNQIEDPTKIYPGDMIIVPGGQPIPPAPKPALAPKRPTAPKTAAEDLSKAATDISRVNPSAEISSIDLGAKLLWPTTAKRITQGYKTSHRGIDIANGSTPPVFASHGGTVEFAGTSGAWGKTILLRRDDGLLTRYSHESEIYVTVGQKVNAGDTIGLIGNTGRSTGNHLDYRVYINGIATNPMKFF